MSKSKLGVLSLLAILLISLSVVVAASAQYQTEKKIDVTIGSDGTFTATQSDVGVSFVIEGTPGAVGSVTTDVYNGNPQGGATIPSGVTLTHFIGVTFNMNANDFSQATVTLAYTSADVQGIKPNYVIYEYMPDSSSYVRIASTSDANSKTLTVTLTSSALLAIGGETAATTNGGIPTYTWAIMAFSIIVIVVLAVFLVSWIRREKSTF